MINTTSRNYGHGSYIALWLCLNWDEKMEKVNEVSSSKYEAQESTVIILILLIILWLMKSPNSKWFTIVLGITPFFIFIFLQLILKKLGKTSCYSQGKGQARSMFFAEYSIRKHPYKQAALHTIAKTEFKCEPEMSVPLSF